MRLHTGPKHQLAPHPNSIEKQKKPPKHTQQKEKTEENKITVASCTSLSHHLSLVQEESVKMPLLFRSFADKYKKTDDFDGRKTSDFTNTN